MTRDRVTLGLASHWWLKTEDLLIAVNQLREYGVGVLFEQEGTETSVDYNRFLLSIHAALTQEEVEAASQSTSWGYEKRFLDGHPVYQPLLGYDIIRKNGRQTLKARMFSPKRSS